MERRLLFALGLALALWSWPARPAEAGCDLHIPVLVTHHGRPVADVGLSLLYGTGSQPHGTSAPFLITDPSGQALFGCVLAGTDYLIRLTWDDGTGLRTALSEPFDLTPDHRLHLPAQASTFELRPASGEGGQLRIDLAWLQPDVSTWEATGEPDQPPAAGGAAALRRPAAPIARPAPVVAQAQPQRAQAAQSQDAQMAQSQTGESGVSGSLERLRRTFGRPLEGAWGPDTRLSAWRPSRLSLLVGMAVVVTGLSWVPAVRPALARVQARLGPWARPRPC